MTPLNIRKFPAAELDIAHHFHYIGLDDERAALRFLDEVEDAFELIARVPGIGTEWREKKHRLAGMRHVGVSHRFRNYIIFFRVGGGDVEILRIVHGMRNLPQVVDEF